MTLYGPVFELLWQRKVDEAAGLASRASSFVASTARDTRWAPSSTGYQGRVADAESAIPTRVVGIGTGRLDLDDDASRIARPAAVTRAARLPRLVQATPPSTSPPPTLPARPPLWPPWPSTKYRPL